MFARAYGFDVSEFEDEEVDGFILIGNIKNKRKQVIAINKNLKYEEKRFVIAHELSHFFLDSDAFTDGKISLKARFAHIEKNNNTYNKTQEEQEADYFAACLLVPKEMLSEDLKIYNVNKNEYLILAQILSGKYKVSPLCLYRRLIEIAGEEE